MFPGGDPTYLPAQAEGIAIKHDKANKIELPKVKKPRKDLTRKTLVVTIVTNKQVYMYMVVPRI